MSWSVGPKEFVGGERCEGAEWPAPDYMTPEMLEHMSGAEKAADLLRTQPGLDGKVRVSLSGHANPEHNPAEGWVDDYVQVSVTQLR